MNEEVIAEVVQDVKEHYARLVSEGHNPEEIRVDMVNSMDATSKHVFESGHALKVLTSQVYAFNFVYRFNQILGGVNFVLVEAGIDPIHIKEVMFMNDLLVETMEEITGVPIDKIMNDMEETEKRMIENGEEFPSYQDTEEDQIDFDEEDE